MDELKKSYHAVVDRLEEYLQRNICTDPDSRYFGGLCENHRTIPVLDTWPHAVYPATDGYISLYGATGKEEYRVVAERMVDYLIREQSPTGCWCGYCGYPKSYGWNEENAPPGSFFDVEYPGRFMQDIIWSPFSAFGTALYGKVIGRACRLMTLVDREKQKRWRQSFILASEFVVRCVDDAGYTPECGDTLDQIAEVASALYMAYAFTGQERFLERGEAALERVVSHQKDSGEFPFCSSGGRSLHYHFLTVEALQDCYETLAEGPRRSRIGHAVDRALSWGWGLQQQDGDFDWSIHAEGDHKARLSSSFGLALLAIREAVLPYREKVLHALAFLRTRQRPDGGFPVHLGEEESDTCGGSGTLLQGLGRMAMYM